MSSRKQSSFVITLAVAVATCTTFMLWLLLKEDSESLDREFCWKADPHTSPSSADKNGSLKQCAAALEESMNSQAGSRTSVITAYGRHLRNDPSRMPQPVRRSIARSLAQHPGEVYRSLASGSARAGGMSHTALPRNELLVTAQALAHDGIAWKVLLSSQEEFTRKQINRLSHSDFTSSPPKGSDDSAVAATDEAGTVVGALSGAKSFAIGEGEKGRGKRAAYYEMHGFPWLYGVIEKRGLKTGTPVSDFRKSAGRAADLVFSAETAFHKASDEADSRIPAAPRLP